MVSSCNSYGAASLHELPLVQLYQCRHQRRLVLKLTVVVVYEAAAHAVSQCLCVCCCLVPQGMEQTSYVVDDFVREWKKVWEAMACLPNFESDIKGRLLVDLSNEPDSQWQVRGP